MSGTWLRRFLDLIAPRHCVMCGRKLMVQENIICIECLLTIPRTDYERHPYDNPMARLFWGQIPIEKCAALAFYQKHLNWSHLIHCMKYGNRPDIGVYLGRITAKQFQSFHFFDGIDAIVPVPLAKDRQRSRGYNQCECIGQGLSEVTGIPMVTDAVIRTSFKSSQTTKGVEDRRKNVERVFKLRNGKSIENKHVLLVDDVVTTGSTTMSCARPLLEVPGLKLSILSLSFVSDPFIHVNRDTPEGYRKKMNVW